MLPDTASDLARSVDALIAPTDAALVDLRRALHEHPDLSWQEGPTARLVEESLAAAGIEVRRLDGDALVVDLGPATGPRVGLRADMDALPVQETTGLPFASATPEVMHACGHDLHTTALVGACLALARLEREDGLPMFVRAVFQPAEEVQPGGASSLMDQGVLESVDVMYALHCDPKVEVGRVATKVGAITAASDAVHVTLTSRGGHTSRPHLTEDLVYALGQVITQTPAVLGRRLDPRAGANLTWGAVHAGKAPNAIPDSGTVSGTLRCLDVDVWRQASGLLGDVVRDVVRPYGVEVSIDHAPGLPPVVNDAGALAIAEDAAREILGGASVVETEQSLGGEDFAWYLTQVPGALLRLGTRTPGGPAYDLHQGDVVFDERAIGIGARLLALTALRTGVRDTEGQDVRRTFIGL